jgi:hypothetical protein
MMTGRTIWRFFRFFKVSLNLAAGKDLIPERKRLVSNRNIESLPRRGMWLKSIALAIAKMPWASIAQYYSVLAGVFGITYCGNCACTAAASARNSSAAAVAGPASVTPRPSAKALA